MADKIVVMRDGHVEQMGAPLDLYDTPANTFVASFIGSPSMNLIEGKIEQGAFTGQGLSLAMGERAAGLDGRNVTLGMRPEHFQLGEGGFDSTVAVLEPTGSETHIVSRIGGQDIVSVFRERHHVKVGETIHLRPQLDLVHLFDTATGARL